jgi:hypothetical protein
LLALQVNVTAVPDETVVEDALKLLMDGPAPDGTVLDVTSVGI